MAETFSQGNVPYWTNPQRILLAKILNVLAGGGGGGGTKQVYRTNGNPEGVVTSASTDAIAYDPNTLGVWTFGGTPGTNTPWIEEISPA